MAKYKKFYKIGERIWIKDKIKPGIVKSIDKDNLTATILHFTGDGVQEETVKLWDIDKFRVNSSWYNMVKRFHKIFKHPVANEPTMLTKERALIRAKWMKEEIDEFLVAVENGDLAGAADAMADLQYFSVGTNVEMGIDPDPIFRIVQQANMDKLWDGKPKFDEDGKVVKPPTWEDPYNKIKKHIESISK